MLNFNNIIRSSLLMILVFSLSLFTKAAESVSDLDLQNAIDDLNAKIETAKAKGIGVEREKMTVNTAELFASYALWDENNSSQLLEVCKTSSIYKNKAAEIAASLPGFERSESLAIVEEAALRLQKKIDGSIVEKNVPQIDWSKISIDGSHVVNQDGNPVFLSDFTFKPSVSYLTKYYGNLGGFHYDLSFTQSDSKISSSKERELKSLSDGGNFGSPFLGHGVPSWLKEEDPSVTEGSHTFVKYDIDNPKTIELWKKVLAQMVPYLKGQERTKLGYLLANEPHWQTAAKAWSTPKDEIDGAKDNWDTNGVSQYTISKFKTWLEKKHTTIADLNKYWKTDFSSFDDITVEIPMDNNLLGKPIWYDWMKFNEERVTEWFTFLRNTIRKYDEDAVANIKIMPSLWSENGRDNGLDLEALTNLSGVVGNDASANKKKAWGGAEDWEDDYSFNWREMCMSYDFLKSVAPDKVLYNSETHYTMSTAYQDLYMSPDYARCIYWMAAILGCDVNNSWVWARKDTEDGKHPINTAQCSSSFIGSFTTQPRVLNSVIRTNMDLCANGKDIIRLQNVRQPIRIFYSETSALNKRNHMDDVFELYEKLEFTGTPIGFVTKNIINTQDNNLWDVVLVRKTDYVTDDEVAALQTYLDNGGTIIMDNNSLSRNEYMYRQNNILKTSKGKLIEVSSLDDFVSSAFVNLKSSSLAPIEIAESNSKNRNLCISRSVNSDNGRILVTLANIGNVQTKVTIKMKGKSSPAMYRDLFTSKLGTAKDIIVPQDGILFLQMGNLETALKNTKKTSDISFSPSVFNDRITVKGVKKNIKLVNLTGACVLSYSGCGTLIMNTSRVVPGIYVLSVDDAVSYKVVKK